jgi:hypothetical protein
MWPSTNTRVKLRKKEQRKIETQRENERMMEERERCRENEIKAERKGRKE